MSVILGDQITKGILLSRIVHSWPLSGNAIDLVPYPYMMDRITSWFNLVFTWNPGTSFSILKTAPTVLVILLTASIIGYLLFYLFTKVKTRREYLAMGLIVGGALGNLIDRLRFGAVIDFIDWHVGAWHWPAFNVADICITLGIGLYVLYFIKGKNNG